MIQILRGAGRGFCFDLSGSIITKAMRERIKNAETNDDVLYHIRDVCLSDVYIKFSRNNIS